MAYVHKREIALVIGCRLRGLYEFDPLVDRPIHLKCYLGTLYRCAVFSRYDPMNPKDVVVCRRGPRFTQEKTKGSNTQKG